MTSSRCSKGVEGEGPSSLELTRRDSSLKKVCGFGRREKATAKQERTLLQRKAGRTLFCLWEGVSPRGRTDRQSKG